MIETRTYAYDNCSVCNNNRDTRGIPLLLKNIRSLPDQVSALFISNFSERASDTTVSYANASASIRIPNGLFGIITHPMDSNPTREKR